MPLPRSTFRGLGLRLPLPDGWLWFARDGEHFLELGGAVDLDSADKGVARVEAAMELLSAEEACATAAKAY